MRGGCPVRLASLRFSVRFLCSSFSTEKRSVPVFRCLRGRNRLSLNARAGEPRTGLQKKISLSELSVWEETKLSISLYCLKP